MSVAAAKRVVLIEPQELFISYLVKALEEGGLWVVAAAAKIEDAETALLGGPDAVLADLTFANINEFTMPRRIRKIAPYARLVLFGGSGSPAWRANAWAQGINVLLTEKDGPAELIAAAKGPLFTPERQAQARR